MWSYMKKDRLNSFNVGGTPGWGIYLGCETRDTLVENNVVYQVREGVHVWYSNRNNTLVNNIFVDGHIRQIRYENPRDRKHENIKFLRNIVCISGPESELFNLSGQRSAPVESDYNLFYHTGESNLLVKGIEGIDDLKACRQRDMMRIQSLPIPLFGSG